MTTVDKFMEVTPTTENYLRGIVLFGRNVASYKFALAKSLLELAAEQQERVSLDDLAVPFARHLCEHLKTAPKQATSATSRFLETCSSFNRGEISADRLREMTSRLGFANVIDAFHIVGANEIPVRFFLDERTTATRGIRLTDAIRDIATAAPDQAVAEIEARWNLVETAWGLGINQALVAFEPVAYEPGSGMFVWAARRKALASARPALNGYQKGRCFYCFRGIGTTPTATDLADVDHVLPHVLQRRGEFTNLDQVWNLVLACQDCNRGAGGKFHAIPALSYIERLYRRNEYLINSHHPLRETLIKQVGATASQRQEFVQRMFSDAATSGLARWSTPALADPTF
ncbi:MAG: HNH endonuclease domain-containing protein [Deltaproteobacteria bacterium]|nr:HNH endonuclease domain-containing protein [Deltaproteobacteria bacterium]